MIDGLSTQDTGSKLSGPSNGFPELVNGGVLHQGRSPSSRNLNGKAHNAEDIMRQLFIFSANDKAALKTQMDGIGKSSSLRIRSMIELHIASSTKGSLTLE